MEKTKSEMVYWQLKTDINNLKIGTNEFLNEKDIAERYGTSKAPVRNALHRLCMEGILVSHARKGYLIVTLSEAEFLQIRQLRILMETFALEQMMQIVNKKQLEQLLILAAADSTIQDNTVFHLAIANLSKNKYLSDMIERLLAIATRSYYIHSDENKKSDEKISHTVIVLALIAGDIEKAKNLLVQNIQN